MKVFISWSGELSRQVARALRDWLPSVLQAAEPWLAEDDIESGARWSDSFARELSDSSVVLLCVTRDNMRSGWFNFEAGAAARTVDVESVIPVLIDIRPVELTGALGLFQSVMLDEEGITKLLEMVNARQGDHRLPDVILGSVTRVWLPEFLTRLEEALLVGTLDGPAIAEPIVPATSDRERIDEILEELRGLTVEMGRLQIAISRGGTTPLNEPESAPEPSKPKVFIGSSTEGLNIAEAIQAKLEGVAECTVWDQAAFELSRTNIENLVDISAAFKFAIIVMTADDVLIKKGNTTIAPRDNLVFELGLFTGALGRAKTFLVKCRDDVIELPSDLQGVTTAEYSRRTDGNMLAAVTPVCLRIKRAMGLK